MRLDWLAYAGIGLKGQAREHAAHEVPVFTDEQRVVDPNDADSDFGDATGQADPALFDAINALPRVTSCSASTPSPPIVDALLANCMFNLPLLSERQPRGCIGEHHV
jgi:hypothetical protein